jgi:hypothetical protein
MSITAQVGVMIPTNVVEVGNEISSDQLAAIANAQLNPSAANPFVTEGGVPTYDTNSPWPTPPSGMLTADKAMANAIAASLWYTFDTGTDYNKTGGIVNVQLLAGYNTSGVTDGTTFVTGFPSVITSLSNNAYWYVSVNGTISDYIVSDAAP